MAGQQVGYIRVSSVQQNTDRQLDGVELDRTFTDKESGSTTERPQLQAMLAHVREGDTIHVHSIDRLCRNIRDLLGIVEDLKQRGVNIQFHKELMRFDGAGSNPQADLMLHVMAAFAEFERSIIRERQAEGIAKAKAKGVYKGRRPTVDAEGILQARAEGLSFRKTAERFGVALSTVQRVVSEQG